MNDGTTVDNAGWNFDNSYAALPECFFTRIDPSKTHDPRILIVNYALAHEMGLSFKKCSDRELADLFSGNRLPKGSEPLSQAYAGHQFGHFTMLGDGRAHLIGEHTTPNGARFDIQYKGSGKTPYSRRGDGRAALGPMLREYIISEAMNSLRIPTTRSLAVVTTGESVYRETVQQGAILTRVANNHLRVGTFEYLAAKQDIYGLKKLADYAIWRNYPELKESDTAYLDLIKSVMERQISLIVGWLRIGFIHGVMNTDNMAISGETIDYGPCAFMDEYNPQAVFSSIDHMGRYAYGNQPHIAHWNLTRFAECLLPLLHDNAEHATALAENLIQSFDTRFQKTWLAMMRCKLGLFGEDSDDIRLINDLLKWMQQHQTDHTNTFRDLTSESRPKNGLYNTEDFQSWWSRWQARLKRNKKPLKSSLSLMQKNNPAVIPRNHKVEEVLSAAEEQSDLSKLHMLLDVLADPYSDKSNFSEFCHPPKPGERVHQTFCGT